MKIFWVFLEGEIKDTPEKASLNWIGKIPSISPVAHAFAKPTRSLRNFPNYRTFTEYNGVPLFWVIIRLSDDQAALLAHYTAWIVRESAAELRAFLRE